MWNESDITEGMYVRCPFDDESENFPRTFIMGRVESVNRKYFEANIIFYDNQDIGKFLEDIPKKQVYRIEDVSRCLIMEEEKVVFLKGFSKCEGTILEGFKNKEDSFYYYYVLSNAQIEIICEKDIFASFNQAYVNPLQQLISYEFQNPRWYLQRNVVHKFTDVLENAPIGFETLVGARAFLFPHQIDTIMRASKQVPCRLMLADEVGLGKTIEALIIANTLKRKKEGFKTLIIVPSTLMNQWQNEFDIKLWINAQIYEKRGETIHSDHVIIPIEKLESYKQLLSEAWDLVIVDEIHKIIKQDEIYHLLYGLSKRIENILLLTATPISSRRTEYLNLLKLLKPSHYGEMSVEKFDQLVDQNNKIKEHVCEIKNDMEEYFDDPDEGILEDVLSELEEIEQYLNDEYFTKVFHSIDLEDENHGIEKINDLLGYLAEYYQIDRDIIRHRRKELNNKFSKRTLQKIHYTMQDASSYYYENETYIALLAFIKHLKEKQQLSLSVTKGLLNSMFSSPAALNAYLDRIDLEKTSSAYKTLKQQLDEFIYSVEKEAENIEQIIADPDLITSRTSKLIDYIDQEAFDQKVVIFTAYTETAQFLYEILNEYFDEATIRRFYKNLSSEELTAAIYDFQQKNEVKILICDYTAGEGRNLQMADCIIHYDLPLSPSEIEQRIGRLDRIGRDEEKDVVNVVIYAQDTIEENLLRIWEEAFNIFSESLSGLEIALEDFEILLEDYLFNYEQCEFEEVLTKFQVKTAELNKVLREERLYDSNRQLSKRLQRMIEQLIDRVDDNQGESLAQAMGAWGSMVGFNSEKMNMQNHQLVKFTASRFSLGSFRKAWYIPLSTKEILKRSKRANEIIGTFEREVAIKNESFAFFAPGEPIFDSLMHHANKYYKATCCAMEIASDFEFSGIIFNWKTKFQSRYILDNGLSLQHLNEIKGFDVVKTESDLVRLSGSESVTMDKIENLINSTKRYTHLGQRSGYYNQMERFIEIHSPQSWRKTVIQAKKKSLERIKEKTAVRLINVRKQFSKNYQLEHKGHFQSRSFYQSEIVEEQENKKILKALSKGIENCKYELDSVCYIRVIKHE